MSTFRLFDDDAPNYSSASFPPPRDFQSSAHDALRQGVRDGHRLQCVMAPTGSGKTYLGMRVIHETLLRGNSAMFLCDRTTLINQTSAAADGYGLSAHGIMQAQHWRSDRGSKFQIASVQTIAKRGWPDVDVIVIDECHTLYAAWVKHVQECRAAVVGLSATPFAVGMGKLFSNLVNATSMHALTESGVLVPMRVFSCTKVNMAGAETLGKNGEWTDGAAAERGMAILGDVVTEWQKFGENRKTIVFGATIKHCEEMARQFNDSGVMAACFTSDTDANERGALLTEYRKPNSALRVLVSVEALAKGFDVPDVGCVCDVRPLRKSLSTAIQMWGRGLRSSPETGKTDCILLDFSGNIIRFADDFSTIFFDGLDSLDMGEKLDKAIRKDDDEKPEGKACPSCGYKPMGKRCVACGHESKSVSLVEHEAGEMREVTIGKTKYADDKMHLYMQACTYARGNSLPEKQAWRAKFIYKSITGEFPPSHWKFDDTPNATVTRPVLNKIRSQNIAFAHATGRSAA